MIARFPDPEPSRWPMNRWLVQTSCYECLVDVRAASEEGQFGFVAVALLSSHAGRYVTSLSGRLRYAWRILRGRIWADIELMDRQQVDDLIEVLLEARDLAYPPTCTRETGHDGPCNGLPCESVKAKIAQCAKEHAAIAFDIKASPEVIEMAEAIAAQRAKEQING